MINVNKKKNKKNQKYFNKEKLTFIYSQSVTDLSTFFKTKNWINFCSLFQKWTKVLQRYAKKKLIGTRMNGQTKSKNDNETTLHDVPRCENQIWPMTLNQTNHHINIPFCFLLLSEMISIKDPNKKKMITKFRALIIAIVIWSLYFVFIRFF